ncbi:hypothetical protein SKAU_G00090690 [Synaphobranchus kaupii]|uniref:Uncharacterized protein n=1 Tax=Synaphobranchus kaupii TaxID=118154 RepID=A0A9Q1FWM0_SYNKA|nr:hypothetical protein SKAU_G00090690 [Synaphobranchus kaupii]
MYQSRLADLCNDQRGPPLFGRLIQELQEKVAEGLSHGAVAAGREVQEVKHVPRGDGAIRVHEAGADIQELCGTKTGQPGPQEPVHRRVLHPERVGPLAAGEEGPEWEPIRLLERCDGGKIDSQ